MGKQANTNHLLLDIFELFTAEQVEVSSESPMKISGAHIILYHVLILVSNFTLQSFFKKMNVICELKDFILLKRHIVSNPISTFNNAVPRTFTVQRGRIQGKGRRR